MPKAAAKGSNFAPLPCSAISISAALITLGSMDFFIPALSLARIIGAKVHLTTSQATGWFDRPRLTPPYSRRFCLGAGGTKDARDRHPDQTAAQVRAAHSH